MTDLFTFLEAPPARDVDRHGAHWRFGDLGEANALLAQHHYLGAIKAGGAFRVVVGQVAGEVVAAQVWRRPTSRRLPADGTWLELSRWCLTPSAGPNAGSRQHRAAVRLLRRESPVTTLVSYSDHGHGHTGVLYRACNWLWAPTWLRLRPPPTGNGDWGSGSQGTKDRWVFPVRRDIRIGNLLQINDRGAIRHWLRGEPTYRELRLALRSPAPDLSAAAHSVMWPARGVSV